MCSLKATCHQTLMNPFSKKNKWWVGCKGKSVFGLLELLLIGARGMEFYTLNWWHMGTVPHSHAAMQANHHVTCNASEQEECRGDAMRVRGLIATTYHPVIRTIRTSAVLYSGYNNLRMLMQRYNHTRCALRQHSNAHVHLHKNTKATKGPARVRSAPSDVMVLDFDGVIVDSEPEVRLPCSMRLTSGLQPNWYMFCACRLHSQPM